MTEANYKWYTEAYFISFDANVVAASDKATFHISGKAYHHIWGSEKSQNV